jgi:hypothetical protein
VFTVYILGIVTGPRWASWARRRIIEAGLIAVHLRKSILGDGYYKATASENILFLEAIEYRQGMIFFKQKYGHKFIVHT